MLKLIWNASMRWCHLVCHQKPERSFFVKGYQFPLCARCTGIVIGFIFAIICLIFKCFISFKGSLILSLIMLTDWLIQFAKIKESTNIRRLITGILGGFGLSNLYYFIIIFIHNKIV